MCLSCVSPLQSVMVTGAPLMLPIKIIHVLQSCAFVALPSFPPFCEDPVPPWKLFFLLHFCQKLSKELVPVFCSFWPLEVPQVGSGPTARAGEAGVQHQQLLTQSSSLPSCAGRFRPCWDSLSWELRAGLGQALGSHGEGGAGPPSVRACAASRGCCQQGLLPGPVWQTRGGEEGAAYRKLLPWGAHVAAAPKGRRFCLTRCWEGKRLLIKKLQCK